jgi:hypothetical protein
MLDLACQDLECLIPLKGHDSFCKGRFPCIGMICEATRDSKLPTRVKKRRCSRTRSERRRPQYLRLTQPARQISRARLSPLRSLLDCPHTRITSLLRVGRSFIDGAPTPNSRAPNSLARSCTNNAATCPNAPSAARHDILAKHLAKIPMRPIRRPFAS